MSRDTISSLSGKQRLFFEAYLTSWNATQAATKAGYSNPDKAGSRVLKSPKVKRAIEEALETLVMSRDEALAILSSHARAEYAEFITDEGEIDLTKMTERGKMHLIKGVRPTRYGLVVEFHDAQEAVIQIMRHHERIKARGELGDALSEALDTISETYNANL